MRRVPRRTAGHAELRPSAASLIHGNGGPSSTVFVGEVDQQCVAVVLDAQAMPRIRLLVQTPDNLSADAGDMLLQALVACAGVTLRAVPTRRRSGWRCQIVCVQDQ